MSRFDSELELETHELGRSLLLMIRDDDDVGLMSMPLPTSVDVLDNPFRDFRERLATAAVAIRDLHPQVHMLFIFCCGIL